MSCSRSSTTTTQPKYKLTAHEQLRRRLVRSRRAAAAAAAHASAAPTPAPAAPEGGGGGDMGGSRRRRRRSGLEIGPYDYAVLKADNEDAMLQWLADNHYFVPAGTDDAVRPYIHPGAYFLALKLRGGERPATSRRWCCEYQSDLPMIPIMLTSVGAVDEHGHPGVDARRGRAIPRNYYHIVIDDAADWFNGCSNYNESVIAAVHEAPGKHAFVTEYAGAGVAGARPARLSGPLRRSDTAARADDQVRLSATTCAITTTSSTRSCSILSRYIPEPKALVDAGVPLATFYQYYDNYADLR